VIFLITPKIEAEKIIDALFDAWGVSGVAHGPGVFVEGRTAILEMIEKGWPSWKEVEWPGFYVKYKALELSNLKFPGNFKALKPSPKLRLMKGNYLWDIRFTSTATTDIEETPKNIILNDTIIQQKILDEFGGFGLVLVDTLVSMDFDGKFIKWLTELKGGKTQYDKKRIADDRPPRTRKKDFMVKKIYAVYFTKDRFLEGVEEEWLKDNFQRTMRQHDASARSPKYLLYFDRIPDDCKLFVTNFNFDPDDFKYIHGDSFFGEF